MLVAPKLRKLVIELEVMPSPVSHGALISSLKSDFSYADVCMQAEGLLHLWLNVDQMLRSLISTQSLASIPTDLEICLKDISQLGMLRMRIIIFNDDFTAVAMS